MSDFRPGLGEIEGLGTVPPYRMEALGHETPNAACVCFSEKEKEGKKG